MSESDDEGNNLMEESKFTGHTKPMSEIESEFNDEDGDSDDEDECLNDDNDWIIPVTIRQDEPTNGTETSIVMLMTKGQDNVTNGTVTSRMMVDAEAESRRSLVDMAESTDKT